MKRKIGILIKEMIDFEEGNPQKINHFLKVYGFAKSIGELEAIDSDTQYILDVAAVLHDIGIKPALEKHGSGAGNYQELEGPPEARRMLKKHGFDNQFIDRICFLIGNHHSYDDIRGIDHQILVEADFLVNIFEGQMDGEQIESVRDNIFKTKTGIDFIQKMFL